MKVWLLSWDNTVCGIYDDLHKAMIGFNELLCSEKMNVLHFEMIQDTVYFNTSYSKKGERGTVYSCRITPIIVNKNLYGKK